MLHILFIVFAAITGLLILYYLIIFSRFSFSKKEKPTDKNIPISVIICAKNEAKNLKNNLPKILNQDYPNFEIVLINDASYDETLEVMETFEKKHNRIKIVDVVNNEAFWGNKKYALTLGIKAAKNDHLLFTDADCFPESDQWIRTMSNHFTNKKTIILGYGAYSKTKNSLTNLMIRFETLLTAITYFSFAKIGIPYMGVGRNLAYHRSVFYNSNGFISHMNIRSGDDDLFINEVATKENTTICFSEDSFTYSEPPVSFLKWFRQKRRHISTAKHYKFIHKALLAFYYILQVSFWITFIVLLAFLHQWIIVLSIFGGKLLLQYIVIGKAAANLKSGKVIILLPFLEVFLILFQFGIFIANSISKPNHWK